MKKSELTAMTVAELKALAKKKKIALSAAAKKAEIVETLAQAIGVSARTATPAKSAKSAKAPVSPTTVKAGAKATKKTARVKPAAPKVAKRTPAARIPEQKETKTAPARTPQREWKMPPGAEEPIMAQTRVSEAKYYTGAGRPQSSSYESLPSEYGEDRIVLIARDPFTVYSYWEATPARLERERAWFGLDSKLTIRIYDVTGVGAFNGANATSYLDQEVFDRIGSWYVDLGRPAHAFYADLGLLAPNGRFLTLARSNRVGMPRDSVSDRSDEDRLFMDEEFSALYDISGEAGGQSSFRGQDMRRQRKGRGHQITSPGMFSRRQPKRE